MIAKKDFVAVIETMKEADKFYQAIDDICRDYGVGYAYADSGMSGNLQSALIDVLGNMFGDETETISWWVFDRNYGKEKPWISIRGDDGGFIEYVLDTPEKLYDFLVRNMEE